LKKIIFCLMLLIIFVATPVFGLPSFQNSPDGFRGIKWGDPPSTLGNYESLSGNDEYMKIYTRPDDKMRLGEVRLYNIYYIFYLDRFMGIHITTVSEYFSELKDILITQFGEPKQKNPNIEEYTWVDSKAVMVLEKEIFSKFCNFRITSCVEMDLMEKDKKERSKNASQDF